MSKIPAQAKCVFKGVVFDIYQWQQTLFDGSVTTFEMAKRADTVVVIALQGDCVWYARQQQPGKAPYLSLFGGRAEPGETPLLAAQRELLEETGLASTQWRQFRQYNAPGKIDWAVTYFIAADCQKIAEPRLDAGEKIELLAATVDNFIHNIVPSVTFAEFELRRELLCGFNTEAAAALKLELGKL